jgi:hypothetical protein
MKSTSSTKCRSVVLISLAAACALVPDLRADWGSSRANNRPTVRHAFYRAGFYPGTVLRALPVGYVQTSVGTTGYYYHDGVYFRPTTEGTYTVVAPPVGAIVPQLPSGAETIALESVTYYYGGGALYLQQPTGFAVVEAPPGITLAELPFGTAPVVINGVIYYVAGSTYFLPVRQAGVTVYVTAQP